MDLAGSLGSRSAGNSVELEQEPFDRSLYAPPVASSQLAVAECYCLNGQAAGSQPQNATIVTDFTGILSGGSMSIAPGTSAFFTFSFVTDIPDYILQTLTQEQVDTFQQYTTEQEDLFRQAITEFTEASGLVGFEVPSGQGDVNILLFDLAEFDILNGGAAGFAYGPTAYDGDILSDIFIDDQYALAYDVLLHELGHAFGLKHPFDGDPVLDDAYDNYGYTVMSYDRTGFTQSLGPFDIEAIQYLYGDADADGNHVASWSWDSQTYTLTQLGFDTDDHLPGVGTRDIIDGAGGNDTIYGRMGDDELTGGDGDDLLNGGRGNDLLFGSAGADNLYGGDGDDLLDGGTESDYVFGERGNDTVYGGAGTDYLSGGVGDDFLNGGADGDTLLGDQGDDELIGGDGNDYLYAGDGNDRLEGGQGDDWLEIGNYYNSPSAGISTAFGGDGNDSFRVYYGETTLLGGSGADVFYIYGGANTIYAGPGADAEYFVIDGGTNTVFAGDGDDYLNWSFHDDGSTLDYFGGDGEDTLLVQLIASAGGVVSIANLAELGLSTNGIENLSLQGSDIAETLHDDFSSGRGYIAGGGGNDTFYTSGWGLEGEDPLDFGSFARVYYGDEGDDTFHLGFASGYIYGGAGADTYVYDRVTDVNGTYYWYIADFEAGIDKFDLSAFPVWGLVIQSNGWVTGTTEVGDFRVYISAASGVLSSSDLTQQAGLGIHLNGWIYADMIEGGDDRDLLQGLEGNDTLHGFGGDDILQGDALGQVDPQVNGNDDTLYGGAGNDRLFGILGSDALFGEGGNDLLAGGAGDDILDGGIGNDTADYTDASSGVEVALWRVGVAQNTLGAGFDALQSIENLAGSFFADLLVGNDSFNILDGNDGDDVLKGLHGNDALKGGLGDDQLIGGYGNDVLRGGDGADVLIGGVGFDIMFGDSGDDYMKGANGTDRMFGGFGNDIIEGGDQTDYLFGQQGNDILLGDAGDDFLQGNLGDDILNGGLGNDRIDGANGNDILRGGEGDDLLIGGWGIDTMTGGTGSDTFQFRTGHTARAQNFADTITDFSLAEGDLIDLSHLDADVGTAVDDAFTFIGTATFSGSAGELRTYSIGEDSFLAGDTDGDGSADFFIRLEGVTDLLETAFTL